MSSCAGLTGRTGGEAPAHPAQPEARKPLSPSSTGPGDTEKKAFDDIIAAFQKENPNITVKTDTVPYASVATNIDSRFQAGNPPDLFRVSYIDIGQYTSQDVLLDVSGTFDQAKIDAFVPGLWEGIVYDGKPYGVPHQIDCTAILYRKDAFEAAGITNVPTTLDEAWTWEQFGDVADKLKGVVKGKQSPFIYDWQAAGAYRWLSWLFQAGGNLLGPDLKAPAIDSDDGRKAVEFTQSFFPNGWVAKNTSVKATTYPDNEFNAGTVAMAFAGSFLVPGINSGVGDKFEYASAVMPRDVAAATDLGGNAIVAAKDGKNTEAAAKFLEFIVREDQMKTFCEKTERAADPEVADRDQARLQDQARPDAAVRAGGLHDHARAGPPGHGAAVRQAQHRPAERAGEGVPRRA